MTIERKVGMGIAGQPTGPATDVAEVFSTYIYTGDGSSGQNIVNGIDLDTEGGMVWCKSRGSNDAHCIYDTERGAGKVLNSNGTNAQYTNTNAGSKLDFNTNGFFTGGNYGGSENGSGQDIVSWTFRKKEKFFDVVTYTGNDTINRMINHNLGSTPGCIIVKAATYDGGAPWSVYHTSLGRTKGLNLNNTSAATTDSGYWYNQNPTDTQFGVGSDSGTNGTGYTYVAYLFADNSLEDLDDQMIKCNTMTGQTTINLGWEPQWLLRKRTDATGDWTIIDSMRGLTVAGENDPTLSPNINANFENSSTDPVGINSTGFSSDANGTYIYVAIRAPMMVEPEAATDVFALSTGNTSATLISAGFPSDFIISKGHGSGETPVASTRLTNGDGKRYLRTDSNSVELVGGGGKIFEFDLGHNFRQSWGNDPSTTYMFKRAKGFFDVVTFANNSTNAVSHNLGVAPEMAIVKTRAIAGSWNVDFVSANVRGNLDVVFPFDAGNAFDPYSSTTFAGSGGTAGITKIAYLFATLAGISKVGNYTGNGSSQTINCGFSAGARFILIKQSNGYPDWYVWDSARGIVAGNDPHWSTNSTAAQVTNDDSVDPTNSGFIVNQVSATGINASGGNYVFLAIA